MATKIERLRCKSGLHEWHLEIDAGRCCNGWTLLWMPMRFMFLNAIPEDCQLDPKAAVWTPILIKSEHTRLIGRILEATPYQHLVGREAVH